MYSTRICSENTTSHNIRAETVEGVGEKPARAAKEIYQQRDGARAFNFHVHFDGGRNYNIGVPIREAMQCDQAVLWAKELVGKQASFLASPTEGDDEGVLDALQASYATLFAEMKAIQYFGEHAPFEKAFEAFEDRAKAALVSVDFTDYKKAIKQLDEFLSGFQAERSDDSSNSPDDEALSSEISNYAGNGVGGGFFKSNDLIEADNLPKEIEEKTGDRDLSAVSKPLAGAESPSSFVGERSLQSNNTTVESRGINASNERPSESAESFADLRRLIDESAERLEEFERRSKSDLTGETIARFTGQDRWNSADSANVVKKVKIKKVSSTKKRKWFPFSTAQAGGRFRRMENNIRQPSLASGENKASVRDDLCTPLSSGHSQFPKEGRGREEIARDVEMYARHFKQEIKREDCNLTLLRNVSILFVRAYADLARLSNSKHEAKLHEKRDYFTVMAKNFDNPKLRDNPDWQSLKSQYLAVFEESAQEIANFVNKKPKQRS